MKTNEPQTTTPHTILSVDMEKRQWSNTKHQNATKTPNRRVDSNSQFFRVQQTHFYAKQSELTLAGVLLCISGPRGASFA